ncbi:hypothetical protein JOC37_000697 [Desulfohalotomaculum tongense]|nr:hypothetical protein [Desulforadius tongensis]MBM7854324.1 hypothetical protein [Desulforadius tongensis]
MKYLVTWVEGNEVQYRFIDSPEEFDKNLYEDYHLIVAPLEDE